MSKNFDLISTVSINLENPIVDETSFGNLLIVGPLPAVSPSTAPSLFAKYTSLDEVIAAGWVAEGSGADPVGVAAKVAFAQNPTPSQIYIAPLQSTTSGGTTTQETAVTCVTRYIDDPNWYILCTAGVAKSEYGSIATYIETTEKMFVYTELDFFGGGTGGTNQASVTGEKYRTLGIFGKTTSGQVATDIPECNKHINVAYAAKWLSYQSGSETAAFKELNLVTPSVLSKTETDSLTANCVNFLITVGSKNVTIGGKVIAGEWGDIIRFRDWLKNDMQTRVATLFTSVAKIPFDDAGITLVQNQMIASLKAGQAAGGIAEDEYDADGNLIAGFTTSVPYAANISASQRSLRTLTDCKFNARLLGAIHFAQISGSLTYES